MLLKYVCFLARKTHVVKRFWQEPASKFSEKDEPYQGLREWASCLPMMMLKTSFLLKVLNAKPLLALRLLVWFRDEHLPILLGGATELGIVYINRIRGAKEVRNLKNHRGDTHEHFRRQRRGVCWGDELKVVARFCFNRG